MRERGGGRELKRGEEERELHPVWRGPVNGQEGED